MINITFSESSKKALYAEINNKVDGMRELNTVYAKNEIMSAAFSISAIKFVKQTNMMARSVKKSFHHVYEWNKVGNETGRLFRVLKKQEGGGNASIYYKFNNSKAASPIAAQLKVPGKTGKSVLKSGVFKRKAEVMESGKSVSFITSRTIVFSPRNGGIVFIPPGKTINIKSPGGDSTSGSFDAHFRSWWQINFASILNESGVISKLEKNVAKALGKQNSGKAMVRSEIKRTLAPYSTVGSVI